MLSVDSCFWLATKREVQMRILRFTSSGWDIRRKERRWWRQNGYPDRRPRPLSLRYDGWWVEGGWGAVGVVVVDINPSKMLDWRSHA